MLFNRASEIVTIKAMAFRNDASAELVTITEMSLDRCRFTSAATFADGERLRLHIRGQGLIEVRAQFTTDGIVHAAFSIECRV